MDQSILRCFSFTGNTKGWQHIVYTLRLVGGICKCRRAAPDLLPLLLWLFWPFLSDNALNSAHTIIQRDDDIMYIVSQGYFPQAAETGRIHTEM